MLGLNRFFFFPSFTPLQSVPCLPSLCLTVEQWTQNKTRQLVHGRVSVCVGLCYPTFMLSFSGCFAAVARSLLVTHLPLSPLPFPSRVGRLCRGFVVPTFTFLCCPAVFVDTVSVQHSGEASRDRAGESEDHAALCYRRMLPFWCTHF